MTTNVTFILRCVLASAGRLSNRAAKAAAVRDASSGLGKQVINGQVARGQVRYRPAHINYNLISLILVSNTQQI